MATRTLIRNVEQITDIGDMPYELAEPFLKSVKNPKHLRALEVKCPQVADSDADLWKSMIMRDITDWEKKWIEPKNPRSWWKVYRKLFREQELLLAAQEDALRKSLVTASVSKTEHSATFVPSIVPFSGTIVDARVSAEARQRARAANNGGRSWSSNKNTLSAIGNIRRQTVEAARNRAIQPTRGSDSAIKLSAAKQQIKRAPASMIGESQRIQPRKLLPHEQAIMADHQRNSGQNVTIRAPRTGNRNGGTKAAAAASAIAAAEEKKRQSNEARLRALTSAPKAKFEYGDAEQGMRELENAHQGLSSTSKQPSTLKRKRPAAEIFMPKKHQK